MDMVVYYVIILPVHSDGGNEGDSCGYSSGSDDLAEDGKRETYTFV